VKLKSLLLFIFPVDIILFSLLMLGGQKGHLVCNALFNMWYNHFDIIISGIFSGSTHNNWTDRMLIHSLFVPIVMSVNPLVIIVCMTVNV